MDNQNKIIGLGYRMLGNIEDAKDNAQEVFLKYWRSNYPITIEDQVFWRLYRMTINASIDRLRSKRRKQLWLPLDDMWQLFDKRRNPQQRIEDSELIQTIDHLMHRLKPKQKACFVMRDIEHQSIKEIASCLNCSENNIKVNLHHARKKLRKWIKPYIME